MENEHIERRERFRIEDTAILEIRAVDDQQRRSIPAEKQFEASASFRLMRELRDIDQDNRALLKRIGEKHAEIGSYLLALNAKIDAIGKAAAEDLLIDPHQLQDVDLSEGGIGFNHATALEERSTHAIKIWFHRTFFGIAAYISVVACNRAIDGGYHISSTFIDLPDADEKIIARHIMQLQARQQRLKRLLKD